MLKLKYYVSTILVLPFLLGNGIHSAPAFQEMSDRNVRKKAFIEFLAPQVQAINEEILEDRKQLLSLYEKSKKQIALDLSELEWLEKISQAHRLPKFKVTKSRNWEELLLRVDIIPVSLAVAQAANESGWGTSRFAVQGNNYFGQYCTRPGCGIAPLLGRKGGSEAQKFGSVFHSIRSYIQNLNSHNAYAKVRQIRAKMRESKQPIDGGQLANGLESYSERGKDYIRDLQTMIRLHDLEKVAIN